MLLLSPRFCWLTALSLALVHGQTSLRGAQPAVSTPRVAQIARTRILGGRLAAGDGRGGLRRLDDGHFSLDELHLRTICAGCPMAHDASKPVDAATKAAALAALRLQGQKDGKALDLVKVVSFTTQVVAGVIYKFKLQVKHHGAPGYTGQMVRAKVLQQAWHTPQFSLLQFADAGGLRGGGGGSF